MPRARSEVMVTVVPIILGLVLAVTGITQGSRRNTFIGLALAATGVVGLVAPRLLPAAPELDPERARARRTAAVILPNGIIYLILGILLIVAISPSERGGTTLLITIFAFFMGVLSVISGLGAIVALRRLSTLPHTRATRPPADTERREEP